MSKVMILDNDLMDVIAMEKVLKNAGYEVVTLAGPYGVLAKIEFEKPDVLLFNPDMPNIDPSVLLDTISSSPQLSAMAIVATCYGEAEVVEEYCRDLNLHGYYIKDAGFSGLVDYLANFIVP